MLKSVAKLLALILLTVQPILLWAWSHERKVHSPDGTIAVIVRNDCTADLRDVTSGKTITSLYGDAPSLTKYSARACDIAFSFSRDGNLLAARRTSEPVILWAAKRGRRVATLGEEGDQAAGRLKFFRDSGSILSVVSRPTGGRCSRTNGISVWDISTQRELLRVREGKTTEFNRVVLPPDEKTIMVLQGSKKEKAPDQTALPRVACGNYLTDTLRLWDIAAGTELVSLKGQSARYSPEASI
ncbi:MAG: WD40 repeat domain-containing protein [Thermodesulfobacteriota bacterium]